MLSHRANIAAWALLVVIASAAARVLIEVPLDTPLAIHFNTAGTPDGWAPAWFALLLVPLIALVILGMSVLLPKVDPRGDNLQRSQAAVQTIFLSMLALLAAAQLVIVAHALHIPTHVGRIAATLVGQLFVVGGNVMGKVRWNYTFGIRTPWTIANERVWDKTHRFAGRLMVAVGAVITIGAWWASVPGHEEALIITGTAIVVVLPVLRSYQLWKDQKA